MTAGPRLNARSVGEALAALGVIVSLVFVGFEIRQNTTAAKAQAYQDIGLAVSAAWADLAKDGELADILMRANSSDPEVAAGLTPVERNRAQSLLISSLRLWEIVYLDIEIGTLGPEAMNQMGNWRSICEGPLLRSNWEQVRGSLGDSFGQYVGETCNLPWVSSATTS